MATWHQVEEAAPELAARVRARFDAFKHKVLATLRKDGSPRVSGIEVEFSGGDVWLGGMLGSLKCRDLQRDPRFALHSGTEDPPDKPEPGTVFDVKIAGRAVEVTDAETLAAHGGGGGEAAFHLFKADITELVLVGLGDPGDHLVIESWHEGAGVRRVERR
jgi:Pyridoxamine 5'-phosphate oxidase